MQRILVIVYILSVFSVFWLTPLSLFTDALMQVLTLGGILTFFIYRYYEIRLYRNLFLLILILTLSSVLAAYFVVGQDILSGVIVSQQLSKGFAVFMIIHWYRSGKINYPQTLKIIIPIIWLYAVLIAIISVLDLQFEYISPLSGNVFHMTAGNYSKDLLFFGILYYLVRYFTSSNFINLLYAGIIFITTQLYDVQRGDYIFIFLLILILLYSYRSKLSGIKILFFSPVIILTAIIALSTVNLKTFNEKFNQFFMIFNEEKVEKITDPSVFVRLEETAFALEGFSESPTFGNGLIRSSKQKKLLGDVYFYPSDVGLIGVLYSFGILGVLLYFAIGIGILRIKRKELEFNSLVFYIYVIYIFLYSIKDGSVIYFPEQVVFCLFMVDYLKRIENTNELRTPQLKK